METRQVETKSFHYVYIAADGTEFKEESECTKYEESAICILRSRVRKLAKKITMEDCIFSCGSGDCECWVVVPTNEKELNDVRQLLAYMNNTLDYVGLLKDDQIGRVIFLTWGYGNSELYFQTLDGLLSNFSSEDFNVKYTINGQ